MEKSLTNVTGSLPTTIDDLSKFVLIGREKLAAVRAAIRAIDKVGVAKEVYQQKLHEAQDIAEAVLDAETRFGDLMLQVPKATKGTGANRYTASKPRENDTAVEFSKPEQQTDSVTEKEDDFLDVVFSEPTEKPEPVKTKAQVIEEAGFTQKQVERFQALANNPDLVEQAKATARENDEIVSRSDVLKLVNKQKKKQQVQEAEKAIQAQVQEADKPVLCIGNSIGFIPEEKYDLLLTDPPYSTDIDDIESFVDDWLYNALDNVKDTGFAYVFIGAYPNELKAYLNAKLPPHITLCQQLIWTYKNTLGNNPKDRYKQNYQVCLFYRGVNAPDLDCPLTSEQWAVQEINAPDGRQGDRYHAWQKPMEIAERFIRHSTKQGMTVFDPFACTGTFLLAAAKLGRKAYGFEINPDNAKIAFERGCVERE